MTKDQFKTEFQSWRIKYPNNPMQAWPDEDKAKVLLIWYGDLKYYSIDTLKKAMVEVYQESPLYFPTCAVVKRECEAVLVRGSGSGRVPTIRFQPEDHGCSLEKQAFEKAHKLLYTVNSYEAFHVRCEGDIRPRCPECGISLAPFENPFIRLLMEQYPDDTECWNPLHKGTILCDACKSFIEAPPRKTLVGPDLGYIDWVQNLVQHRAAGKVVF